MGIIFNKKANKTKREIIDKLYIKLKPFFLNTPMIKNNIITKEINISGIINSK